MLVISDTTPIISLLKINRIDLLKTLYEEVFVPKAVYDELTSNALFDEEATIVTQADFLNVIEVKDRLLVENILMWSGLDLGESEAIACYKQINADLLLIDEKRGRSVAREKGLNIIGTIGILLDAYQSKTITKEEALSYATILRDTNRRISNSLYDAFVLKLDEID